MLHQKADGVRVAGALEDHISWAELDDLARVHDRSPYLTLDYFFWGLLAVLSHLQEFARIPT
jgi:hypothetical protein